MDSQVPREDREIRESRETEEATASLVPRDRGDQQVSLELRDYRDFLAVLEVLGSLDR